MSSDDLEKNQWSPRAPSERILMALKMHGEQTSAQIGQRLGITGEAARQQLLRLAEDGLVTDERRAAGRGRPSTYWHLSQAGNARFPDTHADLTLEILQSVSTVLGEQAVEKVIADREASTLARYRDRIAARRSLRQRVETLAQLRSEEGYMASVEETDEGDILLVENHCPICAAATFCQGFCRAEKAVFSNVLGPDASVERIDHIVNGGRRCSYRITKKAS